MTSQDRVERLQGAIAEASRRLEHQSQLGVERSPGPVPGDFYVFGTPSDAAIEWLVVRQHPDDPGLVLLAPADDFPLVGRSDIPLNPQFLERPLTIRCGEAAWVIAKACPEHLRVGSVPNEAVTLVRRKLAALARGIVPDEPGAYRCRSRSGICGVAGTDRRRRKAVEHRMEPITAVGKTSILQFQQFTTQPPAGLAEEPQLALAAKSGGTLLADLAESLASDVARYAEVPLNSGGTLVLAADAAGVRVGWKGPAGENPPLLSAFGAKQEAAAKWRVGSQVCQTAPILSSRG